MAFLEFSGGRGNGLQKVGFKNFLVDGFASTSGREARFEQAGTGSSSAVVQLRVDLPKDVS